MEVVRNYDTVSKIHHGRFAWPRQQFRTYAYLYCRKMKLLVSDTVEKSVFSKICFSLKFNCGPER